MAGSAPRIDNIDSQLNDIGTVITGTVITAQYTTNNPDNSGTVFYDVPSSHNITLTPGTWLITGEFSMYITYSSGSNFVGARIAIRDSSDNIVANNISNAVVWSAKTKAWGGRTITAIVNISASTTYKMSYTTQTLGSNTFAALVQVNGTAGQLGLSAVRIK